MWGVDLDGGSVGEGGEAQGWVMDGSGRRRERNAANGEWRVTGKKKEREGERALEGIWRA
jgi:hypothetical protein